jgi:hypothetical protein
MFMMYVDESGDPGLVKSPCRYFVLSGLVVHELSWQPVLERLVAFRQRIKAAYGLKLREEIHAAAMINNPGPLVRIPRHQRLSIIREYADELAGIPELNLLHVVVDKEGKPDDYPVFDNAWRALIQRFENTIAFRNFRGPANLSDRAMVFPDHTDDRRLKQLMKQMRTFNPLPTALGYRNLPMVKVIEEPVMKTSEHSYFIQSADLTAFLLYQHLAPNSFMRKKGGQNYFHRLDPVLCRVASRKDPHGIVRL